MTGSEVERLIEAAARHGAVVEARTRPPLLDEATVAEAYRSHLSGLNLRCLDRHYGVHHGYLGKRFRALGLPVRNYTWKRERAAALAADKEGEA